MFRIIFIALLNFVFFAHMSAQIAIRPQIGINFANLDYESVHGAVTGRTGWHIGADMQIGSPFFVQPGILISTTKLEIRNFGNISVTELHVPIMLGFGLFKIEDPVTWGVRVFAGPELSINVNKNIDDTFSDISKKDIRNFQAAGIIGAGVDFSMLFLDIGYKFGLSDYIRTENADASVDYFYANVGIRLGI